MKKAWKTSEQIAVINFESVINYLRYFIGYTKDDIRTILENLLDDGGDDAA